MAKKDKKTPSLTTQIVVAMILGLVVGVLLFEAEKGGFAREYLLDGLFTVVGKIFVNTLKMLVVPLVFVSLVCGTAALSDPKKLGRVGGKTIGLYMATTAIAISLALGLAMLVGPGLSFGLETNVTFDAKDTPSLKQVLIDIFPENPIKAMADGNMLQVIFFSILFGFALSLVGKPAERLKKLFDEANEVIMKMITILMWLAPYGVFCLLAKVFAEQGLSAIAPLALYFFTVLGALLLHFVGTFSLLLRVVGRLDPRPYFYKLRALILFAFSTSSSNATIPITLETVEHKLGVRNTIASFTIPLGATINMDGTAIMQGVATIFIAQAYGLELGVSALLQVIMTATLASVGTAGVPGVGLITLAMVLRQVGLPVDGIALIIGVDRLLDMTRTAVNVAGDAAVSCVVARSEGQFDEATYANFQAGKDALALSRATT